MRNPRSAEMARYVRFADDEARGRSALYETLARGIAADAEILDFLLGLPNHKRQPNLLFAVVRHLFGTPRDWDGFRDVLLSHRDAVHATILARATQTNEPARCAVLLPVLVGLPQPLALIEVGASAGLCLLPDHYAYNYGGGIVRSKAAGDDGPVFACSAGAGVPLPAIVPQIAWRAGLDLNPLDVTDPSQAAWLETLVWPEQTGRLARLRAAMKIAALNKPRVTRGDLLGDDLARLCCEAPDDATLVVFHSAVLGYVTDSADRQAFAASVGSLCQYWISNEAPQVFPAHAAGAGTPAVKGRFVMAVNGVPVAWTDPHGSALDWIGGS